MKTKILMTAILVLAIVASSVAQPGRDKNKEEIKAQKVGFITKALNLTADEAQKFWPAYNEFQDKMEKLHKERRDLFRSAKDKGGIDSLSNAEVEKMVDKGVSLEEKELQLKKDFLAKAKTILPIKKVAKLYPAEHEFRREILKKMRDHKGGGGRPGDRGGDFPEDDKE